MLRQEEPEQKAAPPVLGELIMLIIPCISFLLLLAASASCTGAQEQEAACNSEKLPIQVIKLLREKAPAYRIADFKDLDEDDQKIWKAAHPGKCPGFAQGHFQSQDQISYAVLLFKNGHENFNQFLVVVTPRSKGGYLFTNLEKYEGPRVQVAYALPPGMYHSSDHSKRVSLKADSIALETIEAGTLIFYWRNRKFNRLLTSE